MEKIKKLLNNPWIIIFLLSMPAVIALLVPGYFGASDDMHPAWLYEMHRAITAGQFPVRFVPDLSFGFGYPLFNFVFPLPFYLAEIFYLLGFTLVGSIKMVLFVSLFLSGISMFYLLNNLSNRSPAILGSIIYMYTPFRSTEIYVRGAVGEAMAFVFLPLIILSVIKVLEKSKSKPKWIGIGALSIAGLITSHNITAFMFIPLTFLFIPLYLVIYKKGLASSGSYLVMIFLGLISSSFFWIPALKDSKLMEYDTVFNYFDHFPTIKQLITPYFGYGASVPGPGDGMSFYIGLFNLTLVIISVYVLVKYWKNINKMHKVVMFWTLSIFFISIVFMNFRSTILWERIPLISYFQFPWRFLILTTLTTSIMTLSLSYFKISNKIFSILICLVVIASFYIFRPADFLARGDDYYLKRYIPYPSVDDSYLLQNEEYLRLPAGTKLRPGNINYKIKIDSGDFTVEEINPLDIKILVDTKSGTDLEYFKYYFPGWKAYVNGKAVEIRTGYPYGHITITLPEGTSEIKIIFRETGEKILLNMISLFGFTFCVLLIFKYRKASDQKVT